MLIKHEQDRQVTAQNQQEAFKEIKEIMGFSKITETEVQKHIDKFKHQIKMLEGERDILKR